MQTENTVEAPDDKTQKGQRRLSVLVGRGLQDTRGRRHLIQNQH